MRHGNRVLLIWLAIFMAAYLASLVPDLWRLGESQRRTKERVLRTTKTADLGEGR